MKKIFLTKNEKISIAVAASAIYLMHVIFNLTGVIDLQWKWFALPLILVPVIYLAPYILGVPVALYYFFKNLFNKNQ